METGWRAGEGVVVQIAQRPDLWHTAHRDCGQGHQGLYNSGHGSLKDPGSALTW
jgi:hypothetical protein